jgi:hypothetical protein
MAAIRDRTKRDRVSEAFRAGKPIDAAIRRAARLAREQTRPAARKKRRAAGPVAG